MLISPSSQKQRVLAIFDREDEWGSFPWPLPNMHEIPESTFWGWRISYSFKAEINSVDSFLYEGVRYTAIAYIVDHSQLIDGGFVVLVNRDYPTPKPVRYFQFTKCPHDFVEKNVGHCLHQYTCKHCQKSYTVDSSG